MGTEIAVALPQMGESVVEGTVERWCVSEGDSVEKDQTLCEITTDKVDAEIPAPEAGVVKRILVRVGQTVEVGTELLILETSVSGVGAEPRPDPARVPAAAPVAPAEHGTTRGVAASEPAAAPVPQPEPSSEPRVSPLARRIADERGIDLGTVQGSGSGGRIVRADVAEVRTGRVVASSEPAGPAVAAAAPRPSAPATLGSWLEGMRIPTYTPREGDRVIPFSTVRRRVAEHMVVSKIVSPHVGTVAELDLHRLVSLRESVKAEFKQSHGFGLTYLPFVVLATVRVLKDFPRMNATVVGETIVERDGFHIGVAVETERGLLVPVIRHAERLSLVGLATAIEDLSSRARARKIQADELQGGTFTVTNPGRQGNLYGFAVINQPQVGILRMGEVKRRPVVVDQEGADAIVVHPMMHLALSYDHRIIDGMTGNGFLYHVARYLEAGEFEV